jgi:enoyl-CoA hydratase
MQLDSFKSMLVARDAGVTTVTLNNPDKLNALDPQAERELGQFFYEVATDAETHVIVLTGAGRAFSAGGSLDNMRHHIAHPDEFYTSNVHSKRTVFNMLDCPKPIIAKVNGHAMGLGATVALLADVVFASAQAKFADPHVKMGFTSGDGGAFLWPFLLGGLAKHYLMTGEPILATDAERLGMIYRALPPAELDAAVAEYALRLATGPRRAIQTSKMTANLILKQLASLTMDAGLAYEALTNHSADHLEAVNAFADKRPAAFTGK